MEYEAFDRLYSLPCIKLDNPAIYEVWKGNIKHNLTLAGLWDGAKERPADNKACFYILRTIIDPPRHLKQAATDAKVFWEAVGVHYNPQTFQNRLNAVRALFKLDVDEAHLGRSLWDLVDRFDALFTAFGADINTLDFNKLKVFAILAALPADLQPIVNQYQSAATTKDDLSIPHLILSIDVYAEAEKPFGTINPKHNRCLNHVRR